jgi:uncharacterized protein (TIRG00374 family)
MLAPSRADRGPVRNCRDLTPDAPRDFLGLPDKDPLVSKRSVINILKYVLAGSLLGYVIFANWGYSERVAGKIVVGTDLATGDDEQPTIVGQVTAYVPNKALFVEKLGPTGQPAGNGMEFVLAPKKTQIEEPASAADIHEGTKVAVWEHPGRGLAYVWRRHVIEREPIHWGFLGLAFLIGLAAIVLTFLRWYVLVRAQDLPFTIPDALRLGFIGFFFNSVMPGSVGGDIIKAAFLAREKRDRKTVAVATVIMDRAIALWALVWFVAISGAIFWASGMLEGQGAARSLFIVKTAGIIVAVSFTAWMLLGLLPAWRAEKFAGRLSRVPKAGHTLAEFWRSVWMYRCRQASVAATMLISWIGHVGFVLFFYFSVLVLWDAKDPAQRIPTLAQHFLLVPIGLVIQAAPLFPGGAGIGELGFGVLYKWLGASVACGVLGSLICRVIQWILGIFGYFVYRHLRTDLPVAESNGGNQMPSPEEMPVAVGS